MNPDNSYYALSFKTKSSDILIALLSQFPFNGFQDLNNGSFKAFIDVPKFDSSIHDAIETLKERHTFEYSIEKIGDENWNAHWESNFEPVIVDNFCAVRADFHEPISTVEHEIIITPQMSFGTGHHQTTFGMIKMMQKVNFADKKVLDFGCGTAVLAILAAKLGAKAVLGVDIDNNAYMNSIENCKKNNFPNIVVKKGGLSEAEQGYDIILANINRHVILESLPSLSMLLKADSFLLISGVLRSDMPLINENLKKTEFAVQDEQHIDEWMCILVKKV